MSAPPATTVSAAATLPAVPPARSRAGNVTFKDVVVRLGNASERRLVLDRISLDVPGGQFVCVLGPSGCTFIINPRLWKAASVARCPMDTIVVCGNSRAIAR